MKLFSIFSEAPLKVATRSLYQQCVERARDPYFYTVLGVPDTPEGRFDMIALHVFMILRRLRPEAGDAPKLSQNLFDMMFADMDQNLREMGVGDLGVGKRIIKMAESFHGRVAAYDREIDDANRDGMADALHRNLYQGTDSDRDLLTTMADYVFAQVTAFDNTAIENHLNGSARFLHPTETGST